MDGSLAAEHSQHVKPLSKSVSCFWVTKIIFNILFSNLQLTGQFWGQQFLNDLSLVQSLQ